MSDGRKITSPINAKRSTGPRTSEGKAVSRLNGIRHGLYSEVTLIAGESEAELVAFGRRLRGSLAPVGEIELILADRIVSVAWRLRRLIEIEGKVLAEAARSNSFDCAPGRAFSGSSGDKMMRVSAYEAKLDRQLFKTLHELQRIQAARRGMLVTPPDAIDVSVSTDHDEDGERQSIEAAAVASLIENSSAVLKR